MLRVLSAKIAKARRFGIRRLVRCRIDRAWLEVLRRHFQFDAWHAQAPYSCRPYKETVVDLVNGLAPSTVVEVGAGLGDLLAHIEAARRYGYDIDAGVVRAARFLHRNRITFVHGDASDVGQDQIDVLIMVNWIHNLSPAELESTLGPLVARTTYLVLDAVDPDGPESYRYKHSFSFLAGLAERVSVTRASDEPRSFHVYRVVR